MLKITIVTIFCAFLFSVSAYGNNASIEYAYELDLSQPDHVNASWLGYLMQRQLFIKEHIDQYALTPGIVVPTFDEEVEGRRTMAQIWKELKDKDQNRKDNYLDELLPVHEADFMREYVWTYLRREGWEKIPKNLRLTEFSRWQQLHLRDHKPETRANLIITKKAAKQN